MRRLYELAVFGSPSEQQAEELRQLVGEAVGHFSLRLGEEVGWHVRPTTFTPEQQTPAAAAFFGGSDALDIDVQYLLDQGIPVVPIVSDETLVHQEIPAALRHLNGLAYNAGGAQRVATALLECAGLLPRQRRVFVSYKRTESRQVALQLFEALSARVFDVFLDTHDILPGEDFQAILWHRLSDSDVLVVLDTPNYLESQWTKAEVLRAQVKGLSILRIGWPDVAVLPAIGTADDLPLIETDLDPSTGELTQEALSRIVLRLEEARSRSVALRRLILTSRLKDSLDTIQGRFSGVGTKQAIHIGLIDGRNLLVLPTVGVPTSMLLQEASSLSPGQSAAVLYDHVGLTPDWLQHLEWLEKHLGVARCLKSREADWQLAHWRDTV